MVLIPYFEEFLFLKLSLKPDLMKSAKFDCESVWTANALKSNFNYFMAPKNNFWL